MKGTDFIRRIHDLSRPDRENAIVEAAFAGSQVAWPMVEIPVVSADGKHQGAFRAAQDYFAVGTPNDFVRVPMSPLAAQRIADRLGLALPTPRMVDLVWKRAELKLEPLPWGPPYDASMLSVDRFVEHNRRVERQRAGRGGLVRGHKKDVVLAAGLATHPSQVAIYGWHRPDGRPWQQLYLGHENTYADYSHGIGFVAPTMRLDGRDVTLAEVLRDPALALLLSGEGQLSALRQPGVTAEADAGDARWHDYSKSLGERSVAWSLAEMAIGVRDASPGNPTGPRIRDYLAPCVRGAAGHAVGLTAGNWCAAAACAAARSCSIPGEVAPHDYRASVEELREDAEANGCFRSAPSARGGEYRPAVGDLALFRRGAPGSWHGHVARVEVSPDDRGRYRTIGGNEGTAGEWKRTERTLADDDLVGFIEYPRLVRPPVEETITPPSAQPPPVAQTSLGNQVRGALAAATSELAVASPAVTPQATPAATALAGVAQAAKALTSPSMMSTVESSAEVVAQLSAVIGAMAKLPAFQLTTDTPSAGPTRKRLDPHWISALVGGLVLAMIGVGASTRIPGQIAWLVEMALFIGAMAVVGLGVGGRAAGILITPQKLMSLARFQMVLWTVLLLSAYFTVVMRRIGLPDPLAVTIDWRLWALMGLSSTSLVGSPLLQLVKRTQVPQDGVTRTTADALGQPEDEVDAHARGILYGNPSIHDARFTDMFGGDEVGNAHLVDASKVQLFLFTIVAAGAYGASLYRLIGGTPAAEITSFPALTSGLVAILGISHAAFLGGKSVRQTPVSTDVDSAPASPVGPSQTEPALSGIAESAGEPHPMVRSVERTPADATHASGELMNAMSRLVERVTGGRDRGDREVARALERVLDKLDSVHTTARVQSRSTEQILEAARRLDDAAKAQDQVTRQLVKSTERLRRNAA
jgi:hypothetical protein